MMSYEIARRQFSVYIGSNPDKNRKGIYRKAVICKKMIDFTII